jgi:uncharacterized membrane protein (DUF106 family)
MAFGFPVIIEIALICLAISIIYQFVYEVSINRKKFTELKKRMKKYRDELKGMSINSKEYGAKQSKMLSINMEIMQLTMKPTLIMMVPFWGIFFIMSSVYKTAGVVIPIPSILSWVPLGIGDGLGWLWTYIICSMIFTTTMRKIFDRYHEGKEK